jgi:acyl carrier protein
MTDENMEKVKAIFCETLGVSAQDVNDETSYNSFEPWDSLKHLEFVAKFESEFGIDIDMDDVIAMEDFKKLKEIVQKYMDKKGT